MMKQMSDIVNYPKFLRKTTLFNITNATYAFCSGFLRFRPAYMFVHSLRSPRKARGVHKIRMEPVKRGETSKETSKERRNQ